jgi:hypothetical protein
MLLLHFFNHIQSWLTALRASTNARTRDIMTVIDAAMNGAAITNRLRFKSAALSDVERTIAPTAAAAN